jgi:ribosomal protein L3 glutamine methyltransferase
MTLWTEASKELFTVRDWIRFGISSFQSSELFYGHGLPGPEEEARALVFHALGLPPSSDSPWLDARLLPQEREQICALLRRRVEERIPVAYLTGEAWLGPWRFSVTSDVIVPRSLIAEVLEEDLLEPFLEEEDTLEQVADICTGGGSLAILLALKFPQAVVDAVDCSEAALNVARENVEAYGLGDQVRLHQGDLYQGLTPAAYDLIISNPPYVNAESMAALPAEYRHEPTLALASGEDGLDHVRRLIAGAPQYLKPSGLLVVESGHNQEALEQAFPHLPFLWLDLPAGDDLVFVLRAEDLG